MSEQAAIEQMTMPKHGEICWNELATKNVEVCKKFYSELFGWQLRGGDVDGVEYNEISLAGGKQFGGMYQMGTEMGEAPSHWTCYVAVDDVDAAAEKVRELGGTIRVPPMDIPKVGRFSVVNDPTGATFAMITLLPHA